MWANAQVYCMRKRSIMKRNEETVTADHPCIPTHEQLEYTRSVLERSISFVSGCDQKVAICLGLFGAGLTFFLGDGEISCYIKLIAFVLSQSGVPKWIPNILIILGFLSYFAGITLFIMALYARVRTYPSNIEYFSCVKSINNADELMAKYSQYGVEQKYDATIKQIYINFQIAHKKYHFYNKGLILSSIGFILLSCIKIAASFID